MDNGDFDEDDEEEAAEVDGVLDQEENKSEEPEDGESLDNDIEA